MTEGNVGEMKFFSVYEVGISGVVTFLSPYDV
jgi:hypothetical protein